MTSSVTLQTRAPLTGAEPWPGQEAGVGRTYGSTAARTRGDDDVGMHPRQKNGTGGGPVGRWDGGAVGDALPHMRLCAAHGAQSTKASGTA